MQTFAKFALGLVASLALSAPALGAQIVDPKLFGVFTGLVTSGEEILTTRFDGVFRFPLAGSTFVLNARIDQGDTDGFDPFRMFLVGGGNQSIDGVQDTFAFLEAFYANGILRLVVSGGGFGNDSGTARLTANVVDGKPVDWRGSVLMGGQAGPASDWDMQATMDSLTFDGEFTGAIPEPASWALMITGFGMAGVAVRRRPLHAVALNS